MERQFSFFEPKARELLFSLDAQEQNPAQTQEQILRNFPRAACFWCKALALLIWIELLWLRVPRGATFYIEISNASLRIQALASPLIMFYQTERANPDSVYGKEWSCSDKVSFGYGCLMSIFYCCAVSGSWPHWELEKDISVGLFFRPCALARMYEDLKPAFAPWDLRSS